MAIKLRYNKKSLKRKDIHLKRKTRKNNIKKYKKKGGVKQDNDFLIKQFDNLSLEEMLDLFKEDLKLCKNLELDIIRESRKIKTIKSSNIKTPYLKVKAICKYDNDEHGCYQKNPKHLEMYAHPSRDEPDENSESRKYIKNYTSCVDKLIIGSYAIFKKNNGSFPIPFYGILEENLKTGDYTDFRQFHFNLLANMCESMEKYANLYDEPLYKKFISNFLIVLEENGITGMYFTNDYEKCLKKLGHTGEESKFLSNTNLYFSNILQSLRK